jgi:hypothetical protein
MEQLSALGVILRNLDLPAKAFTDLKKELARESRTGKRESPERSHKL